MQVMFEADFTYDDPGRTLLLTGGYLKGTKSFENFSEPIEIPPQRMITPENMLSLFVHPVLGKAGETLKGSVIFVDQFGLAVTITSSSRTRLRRLNSSPWVRRSSTR